MSKNTKILTCTAISIGITMLVTWLQIRPLGIFFTIILATFIFTNIMVNNQTSFKLVPPPELKNKLDMLTTKLAKIRKERPAIFCGLATFTLATLAIIGHLISGASVVLIGLILAGLISTRYNFRIVKVPLKVDFTWVEKYDNDLVDEFLPEVNETNRFVLDKAGDEAIITPTGNEEDKSDEIPPDLMIPGTIPEINENSDSSDDDLLLKDPNIDQQKTKTKNDQQMHFKKGYFKKDSSISTSSSDEESLSKGLNFDLIDTPRIQALQKSQSQPSSTREQANTVVTNLVSGLVAWGIGSAGGGNIIGGSSGISGINDTTNQGLSSSTTTSSQNLNDDKLSKKQQNSAKFDNVPLNDDGGNRTSEDESDFEILDTDDLNMNNL